jgi:phosphoglycolate phosphatase
LKKKLNNTGEKYRAAIFDLDGTLLDTLEDIARSMNRVLEAHGLPKHPLDSYRYFVGDGARTLVERVLPREKAWDGQFLEGCLADFLKVYAGNWDANARLYPGIPDMLDSLVSCRLLLGILSNKPHDFTRLCAAKFLDRWPFHAVLGERPGIKRKPAPDGALEIARRLGVSPGRCIYVGDTSIDMKTARSAAMFPVGVLWGFRDERELKEAGAELIIEAPMDLIKFLARG